jgi:hypothetical protein
MGKDRAMALAAEQELQHIGESRGCADYNHDLIHELSRRLDCLWRYDQYIANADWREHLNQFWRDVKAQEEQNIQRLKELLKEEMQSGPF